IPTSAEVFIETRIGRSSNPTQGFVVEIASYAPLSASQYVGPAILGTEPQRFSKPGVPVAQWGPVATLKHDLSIFGSSGISIEFDEWSVPKNVSWSAESGGLA